MQRYEVTIRLAARADLLALYEFIAERSGDLAAGAYVERIVDVCLGLEIFPRRGAARDHVRPGIRTLGFERRATILFQVIARRVDILRVFYGGQNIEEAMRAYFA